MTEINQARGQLAIQALAMPANTNPNGDIFGGWLVSQMDLAGGVAAKLKTAGLADAIRAELERPQRPEPLTQVRQRSVDSLLVESHRGEAVAKLLQQG